jgi:hypothetical protein
MFDDETQPITQVRHNHNIKVTQYAMWILSIHSMLQIKFLDYKHINLQQECLVFVSCERNAHVSENSQYLCVCLTWLNHSMSTKMSTLNTMATDTQT